MKSSDDRPPGIWLLSIVLLLLVFGTSNSLSYKVMFAFYGEDEAFFVSNGINVLYVVVGGVLLFFQERQQGRKNEISRTVKKKFFVMALLDSMGTFLSAMGSVQTPGYLQTLLNQSLIPMILLVSRIFIGTKFGRLQLFGAALIMGGAAISSLSTIFGDDDDEVQIGQIGQKEEPAGKNTMQYLSILFYFLSNVPCAFSAVYKELAFKDENVGVLELTQNVSIYQMVLGFLFAPFCVIPGVQTQSGMTVGEIFTSMGRGVSSYLSFNIGTLLLTLYVILNFCSNYLGLVLTKRTSAAVQQTVSSLLIPSTTLAFSLPVLGKFRERIDSAVVISLGIILLGFIFFQLGSRRNRKRKKVESVATVTPSEKSRMVSETTGLLNLGATATSAIETMNVLPNSPRPKKISFQERTYVEIVVKPGDNTLVCGPLL